jgi:hypothetical protein
MKSRYKKAQPQNSASMPTNPKKTGLLPSPRVSFPGALVVEETEAVTEEGRGKEAESKPRNPLTVWMLTTHGEVEVWKVAEVVEDFEEVPAEAMEEANNNLLRLFALTKRLSTAPSEAEAN